MHHPGPPRFAAVGDTLELAPRDPDPAATYNWRIKSAPVSSQATLGTDDVEEFVPDAPGRYTVELDAPDGVHELTVRAFPGALRPVGGTGLGASGMSGMSGWSGVSGISGVSGRSGISGISGSGSGALGAEKEGEGGGRPRIQLRGRLEGDTVVVEAHPQPHPKSDRNPEDLDVEFLLDDRDEVSRGDVTVDDREVRIPVDAFGDRVRVHGVAIGESYSVPDAVSVEKAGDSVSVVRLNDPPEWSKDVTLYEIYVRGFASDDEESDNTFEALTKRLDYLEELGVDCLWLTPVLQNDHAPHGYNIVDFFDIAEDLGTREDYEAFVDAAHDHGMKVLFDLVMNHSARDHPYFEDAYKNPDSEYYDWYEWQDSGEPGTYFDWEYIANWNFENTKVRRYLLDAVDQWMRVADGFRCDMAWAVPNAFWQELRDRVKSYDREFLLLDETIPYIADFHNGMFDMHFDTTLYFTMRQVGNGHQSADAILDAIDQRTEVGFPDHASFMLYQENHDETRYVVECGEPAALASAGALFTLPGVPMLYGGQELGQLGRRDALAWEESNEELREHYETLIDTRNEIPALQFEGDFHRVDYQADSDRVTAFARQDGGEGYVVALNFGPERATFSVAESVQTRDAVSGEDVLVDGELTVDDVVVLPIQG
jgi:cyclomaltodextrinase